MTLKCIRKAMQLGMTIIFYHLDLYTKVVIELKFHSNAILARSKKTSLCVAHKYLLPVSWFKKIMCSTILITNFTRQRDEEVEWVSRLMTFIYTLSTEKQKS